MRSPTTPGTTRSSPTSPPPRSAPSCNAPTRPSSSHGQGADTLPPAVRRDRRQGTGGHHPLPRGRVEVRLPPQPYEDAPIQGGAEHVPVDGELGGEAFRWAIP